MEHIQLIITIIVLALFVIYTIYKMVTDFKDAKRIILSLVLEAEKRWKEPNQGNIKYSYVVGQIKAWLPTPIRIFLSDRVLSTIIDETLEYIQDELDPDHLHHVDE